MFKSFIERSVFGVCTYIGDQFGIAKTKIRLYFIYLSFFTFGSPVIMDVPSALLAAIAKFSVVVEVGKTMEEYLEKSDWRVNANANSGYSLGGLILNTSGKITANYWLSHIYPEEV